MEKKVTLTLKELKRMHVIHAINAGRSVYLSRIGYNGCMDTDLRKSPLLVCFLQDLIFGSKIETAARRIGYQVRFISQPSEIESSGVPEFDIPEPPRQYAEPLLGISAHLVDQISAWQPALMIFDLSYTGIPWLKWIATLKSVPATRRIPVIAFGAHVNTEALTTATEAGADLVLPRSKFSAGLADILAETARLPDYRALESSCQEPLSSLAIQGLEEFNRGEYFEAHETLEAAWNADSSAGRDLYRAVLQVAVAYLQIERDNYRGARKMFLRLRQWFAPLPDECRGIDVRKLREDAERVYAAVLELGPFRLAEFDRHLFRPVRYRLDDKT